MSAASHKMTDARRLSLPWLIADSSSHWQFFYYSRAMRHSRRQQNKSAGEGLACTQMFFYFSFRSFHKHQRGRRSRKKTIFFFLHPYPLVLAVNNSPAVFVFYHAGSTDFEEKIEGLWTGWRRLSKKGLLSILHLPNPCNTPSQCKYFEIIKPFLLILCLTNDSVR